MRGQAHVASAKYFVMAPESGIERLAVAVGDTTHANSGVGGLVTGRALPIGSVP
jgi:hypothetical protein